jgi:hypothetical protein
MARENPRRGCIRILADRQDDIIQDCFACLDEIDAPGLAEFVGNAREAVRAFQDEDAKPAQALATVVLDAILRLLFAALDFSYSRIRRRPTQSTPSSSRAPTRS